MPTYCYERQNGEIFDEIFSFGEAPEFVFRDGKRCMRNLMAQVSGQTTVVKGSDNSVKRSWPMQPCVASGVHPDQAQELRDHLKDRGCPTEVTGGGNPIYTSAAHQKKALKIRGFNNRKSFG